MDDNSTTTTTTYIQNQTYCASRLQCGVCLITGQRCPLLGNGWNIQPTWWIETMEHCGATHGAQNECID